MPVPSFNRWSWNDLVESSTLYIDDPLYSMYPALKTSWYIGNQEHDLTSCIALLIKATCKLLKVSISNTVLYGSCSGGTAAIHTSDIIKECGVVAINPQLLPIALKLSNYAQVVQMPQQVFKSTVDILKDCPSRYLIIYNVESDEDADNIFKICDSLDFDVTKIYQERKNCELLFYSAQGGPGERKAHSQVETRGVFVSLITHIFKRMGGDKSDCSDMVALSRIWSEYYYQRNDLLNKLWKMQVTQINAKDIKKMDPKGNVQATKLLLSNFSSEVSGAELDYCINLLEIIYYKDEWCYNQFINLLSKRCSNADLNRISKLLQNSFFQLIDAPYLARLYRDGKGVEKDISKALELFERAYSKSDVWCDEYADILLKRGTDEDYAIASELLKINANNGRPWALGNLARLYRDGKGVEKDISKALELFERAYLEDDVWGPEYLGVLIWKSDGSEITRIKDILSSLRKLPNVKILIDVHLNNGSLKCNIINYNRTKQYSAKLYCDGKVIKSIVAQDNFVFNLVADGIYFVEIVCLSTDERGYSHCIEYYSEELKNASPPPRRIDFNKLPFYKAQYPFQDFILDYTKYVKSLDIPLFKKKCYKYGSWNALFYFDGDMICADDEDIVLSGVLKHESMLIWGSEDLEENNLDGSVLSDNVGSNTYVLFNLSGVHIGTDYFGLGKLFYYMSKERIIVSNRYQLLIYYMNATDIGCTLDKEIVYAYMSYNDVFANQPFSDKMIFADTRLLSPEYNMYFDKSGLLFKKTEFSSMISNIRPLSSEEYSESLKESKREIIECLKCCLNNKRFDTIVMDLSGGLDSRVSFAAATNIKDANKLIKIRSVGDENSKDVICATNMADSFGFELDFSLNKIQNIKSDNIDYLANITKQEYLERILSVDFGSSDPGILFGSSTLDRTLNIKGFCGEMIRPDLNRSIFFFPLQQDVVMKKYIESSEDYGLIDYDACGKYRDILLRETFASLHGDDICKCEQMNLYFYNRFHFDLMPRSFEIPVWSVHLSKTAVKTMYSSLLMFKSPKFIYDLIYILNPKVAQFEYQDTIYQAERIVSFNPPYDKYFKIISCDKVNENYWRGMNNYNSFRYSVMNVDVPGKYKDEWSNAEIQSKMYSMMCDWIDYIESTNSEIIAPMMGSFKHQLECCKKGDPSDFQVRKRYTILFKRLSSIANALKLRSDRSIEVINSPHTILKLCN